MKFLAAILFCVAVVTDAEARELRHPARGNPAFTVQVPDDWTHEVDPDNNLIVVAKDSATSFVFTLGALHEKLELAAARILKAANATPPTGKMPASISGQQGFSFDSTMTTPNNPMLLLQMTIVRIGAKGFGSATKLQVHTNTAEQRQLAETVRQSIRIVGAPQ